MSRFPRNTQKWIIEQHRSILPQKLGELKGKTTITVKMGRPKKFIEEVLPDKFDPENAPNFTAVIQFNISGNEGGKWYLDIKDNKMNVSRGQVASPDIIISISDKDYLAIMNHEISSHRAFRNGKLKVKSVFQRSEHSSLLIKLNKLGVI